MRRRSEQGMTLMELLVAMVIGSLVITLVVRGLGLTLNLYDRVAAMTTSMDVRFRESQWWVDSIASLMPCTDAQHCLRGSAEQFSGYSFAPILDDGGKRTPVIWQLQTGPEGSLLVYREGPEYSARSLELSLALPPDAAFSYLQPDGRWDSEWNRNGDNQRLPVAIRIQDGSARVWLFSATLQRPWGRDDYREMLDML